MFKNIHGNTILNNSEGDRSFSTMARVKNYLRTTIIAERRLNNLSLMAIETELLNEKKFNE